eukprot:IDg2383t1
MGPTWNYVLNQRTYLRAFYEQNQILLCGNTSPQQASRPYGNMQESKVYISGKHKLYGFKVELSVRPNGLAVDFSTHCPGSVSERFANFRAITPHKKPVRGILERDEVEFNRKLSSHRILLENFGRMGKMWNRLIYIGEMKKRSRSESQSKYRKKRKERLRIGYRSTILGSDDETQRY